MLRALALRPGAAALRHSNALVRRCGGSASSLDANTYHRVADVTLEGIQDVYDDENDADPSLQMEVEFSDGVLIVHVGSHGTFVLNKQTPNMQLWLSSPVSGPLRYDFCLESSAWLNSRDKHELLPLLTSDFETLVGKRLDFGSVVELIEEAK